VYRATLSLLGYRAYTWFAFDCHLDAIVLGCLVALAARRGWIVPRWVSHPWTPLCALILMFALQSQPDVVTYLLAVILISVVCRPISILNNRVARYLGVISYSLYLSHGYARDVLWPKIMDGSAFPNSALQFIAQLSLAIALASILHFLIELPFLRLKNHFRGKKQTRIQPASVVRVNS
jgi:peptidoglycan/LPS O-acetylase OafA/YrhL